MELSRFWDELELLEIGIPDTPEYRRILLNSEGKEVCMWRDVPLYSGKFLHCVCKTPAGSCSSYSLDVTEDNPSFKLTLNQHEMVNNYRSPAPWNVGFLPQTWADPEQSSLENFWGLNDGQPFETIELSSRVLSQKFGTVSLVKPLAVFLVVNDVHTSVRILTINVRDPLAHKIHTSVDVEQYMPGTLAQVYEWLQSRNGTEERVLLLGDEQTYTSNDISSLIGKAHVSWKLFSEVHMEWSQRSMETFNYGLMFWESYVARDSKVKTSIQRTKSRELYDFAWLSVKEEEDELKRQCSFAIESKDESILEMEEELEVESKPKTKPEKKKKGRKVSNKVQNTSRDSFEFCESEEKVKTGCFCFFKTLK